MNRPPRQRRAPAEAGFLFVSLIVFSLLLSLALFSLATLARGHLQSAHADRDAVTALFAAEAGVVEGLARLNVGDDVSVTLEDGTTLFPAIRPGDDPDWFASILFAPGGPVDPGSGSLLTPTIQPVSNRLPYSTPEPGRDALTIRWFSRQTAQRAGSSLLEIVSTGRSGRHRSRIHVLAEPVGGRSALFLDPEGCRAVDVDFEGALAIHGVVQVNGGCDEAVVAEGRLATPRPVRIAGGFAGSPEELSTPPEIDADGDGIPDPFEPTFDPFEPGPPLPPRVNVPPLPDPLEELLRGVGEGVSSDECEFTSFRATGGVIGPGVYCDGIRFSGSTTLSPGEYVIAGGDFDVFPGRRVEGEGVVLIFTDIVGGAPAGDFTSRRDLSARLVSPREGPFAGVLIVAKQTTELRVPRFDPFDPGSGLDQISLDGLVYAPRATIVWAYPFNRTQVLALELVSAGVRIRRGAIVELIRPSFPILPELTRVGADRVVWLDS